MAIYWKTEEFNDVLNSFAETVLFAGTFVNGDPLSNKFSPEDVVFTTAAINAISAFFSEVDCVGRRYSFSEMAYDLFLTSEGHGAGFWDGDYSEDDGEFLTKAARRYSFDIELDDDLVIIDY